MEFPQSFSSDARREAPPLTGKPLNVFDFPEMIADRYRVHNLEVVAPRFASTERSYMRDFKSRLERAHSRLINIPVDIDELWDQPAPSAKEPSFYTGHGSISRMILERVLCGAIQAK
jgi:hypothetical protein